MEITDVRIKLADNTDARLAAFASVVIDDEFVIHDLKVIRKGIRFFVAMPTRKLTDRCGDCGTKNVLGSRYCNSCGCDLPDAGAGGAKTHVDIAHPISSESRVKIERAVIDAYLREVNEFSGNRSINHQEGSRKSA